MVTIQELFDHALLLDMVEQRMVRVQQHLDTAADLWVLNYTSGAQYSSTWNEVTRKCRGLIVHGNPLVNTQAVVIARPFEKFFNLSEHDEGGRHEQLPLDRPFEVYGKMDGSLGILYSGPDGPAIATRGSFSSEQALWATRYLHSHLGDRTVPTGITLLFEIIYPQNRIVVDYGDHEGLTLLAAVDNDTGADVALPAQWASWLPKVQHYDGINDLQEIASLVAGSHADWDNHEGFVLCFQPPAPGLPSPRVKAKFAEYVRLHRIITGVSSKTIWEFLSDRSIPELGSESKSIDELLEHVPDEFYSWVQATVADLQGQFTAIEAMCREILADPSVDRNDRKSTALFFQTQQHRAVLFKMLDGADYAPLIWRTIKPVAERPFRVDDDV